MATTENEIEEVTPGADSFTVTALDRFKRAKNFTDPWRGMAREDFAFASGDQWLEKDKAKLERERRPVITFNYAEKMIDAVVGAEVQTRQEIAYLPRQVEDAGLADLWTEAAKWVRHQTNAEDEETDAFRDCLICGMGWTETRMDYEEDPEGRVLIRRIDPLEMYWDPAAQQPCLTDARYIFHAVWIDEDEARRRWPEAIALQTNADDTSDKGSTIVNPRDRYSEDDESDVDRRKDQIQAIHYQCFELENHYRIGFPDGTQDVHEDIFKDVQKELDDNNIEYVKFQKKTYYRAFIIGDTVVEKGLSPCQEGFTLKTITAKRDRNKNYWYGLVRVMRDPQRWANKWLSQILHIINSNAKGGLIAEKDAFEDPRRALEEWAKPDSVTLLTEGGLNKVREKQMGQFPQALDRMMDFALGSLPMVTGINLEALGLANRQQAGVLESQRKQAAYGILAPYFDNLRSYRKNQGRILLYFIREYISDGRIIRISGPQGERFLPLTKEEGAHHYDIVVDQSPTSPNMKEKTWEQLTAILPALLKAGVPMPPDVLDYTPFPAAMVQAWKQHIQSGMVSGEQLQELQKQMQQLQQENQQLKMKQGEKQAELQLKAQEQQQEMQLEVQKLQAEIELKRAKMQADIGIDREKIMADLKLKTIELNKEGGLNISADFDSLEEIMKRIEEGQRAMMDSLAQSNMALAQALQNLGQQISRPKSVVFDDNGRPVGIRPN